MGLFCGYGWGREGGGGGRIIFTNEDPELFPASPNIAICPKKSAKHPKSTAEFQILTCFVKTMKICTHDSYQLYFMS